MSVSDTWRPIANFCCAMLVALSLPATAMAKTDLVFIVDGSGSISSADFTLQKNGIVAALQNPLIVPRDGSVALAVVQFSTAAGGPSRVEVPYRLVSSPADITAIVAGVAGMSQIQGSTNPGDGINGATVHLAPNARGDADQSYCLSTDGLRNAGAQTSVALNAAKASAFGLDTFSVIAIEDPPFFFEPDFIAEYGPLVFGGGAVFVVQNTVEFANTVGTLCFPVPLELAGLEVTQASQDLENSVALVENKSTLVRAFVQTVGPDPAVSQARLHGRRGAAVLPGSPLTPVNPGGSVTANQDIISRRPNRDDTLNFRIPDSWTSGTVELEIEGVGGLFDCKEVAGPTANDCKTTVTFNPGSEVEVKFFKVKYADGGGTTIEPSTADLQNLEARLLAIYPTSRIDRTTGSIDMGSGTPDATDVNSRLELMRVLDLCWSIFGCERLYYGAVDQTGQLLFGTGTTGGLANGIPGTVSSGVIRDGNSYGRNRHAHEIGHTAGRHHAVNAVSGSIKVGVCNESASSTAPNFPFIETVSGIQRATLGPLTLGENKEIFGWDSLRNQIIDPRVTFELMSYCGSARWISSFTYEGMRTYINSSFPAALTAAVPGGPQTYQLFRARIDLDNGTAEFDPTGSIVSDMAPPTLPSGPFDLVLKDAGGAELDRIAFEPIEMIQDIVEGGTEEPGNMGLALIPVLMDPNVATVAIEQSGSEIGAITSSPNPPSVTVAFPNGGESLAGPVETFSWTASDPDGDPLTFNVQFSRDGGATWESLLVDHPDVTLDVTLADLGQTNQGLIRVQVSDGFNTAMDTSDATFITPNTPPEVDIQNPTLDQVFVGVQSILFEAFAHDKEDGDLVGGSVAWSSDLDGFLGSGPSFSLGANTLTEGTHAISVTGTDSNGASTIDMTFIQVFRIAPPTATEVEIMVERKSELGEVEIKTGRNGEDNTTVKVYILSDAKFDATQVDPVTLAFGPNGAPVHQIRNELGLVDVDKDGDDDVDVKFRGTGLMCGDTKVTLTGTTLAGEDIIATAEIMTVGKECE